MMILTLEIKERLSTHYSIDPITGCWLWNKCTTRGYGMVTVWGVLFRAHKLFYRIYRGPIPRGLVVRHRCDTPSCVNPYHLKLGTQKQNVHDAMSQGHLKKKLTSDDIIAILESKLSRKQKALKWKVSERTITKIMSKYEIDSNNPKDGG